MLDRPDSQLVIPTEGNAAPTELDAAGQAILKLLHKAAGVAEANSRHALETAQKLSRQLREAENRIAELDAENQLYREKAEQAEQWLHKISTEIEERLIRQPEEERRRMSPRR
jgi:FAD/FMN-containing dehydrogenase